MKKIHLCRNVALKKRLYCFSSISLFSRLFTGLENRTLILVKLTSQNNSKSSRNLDFLLAAGHPAFGNLALELVNRFPGG